MHRSPPPPAPLTPVRRLLLTAAGFVCVGLGVAGIVLPGLPTTPFLLAASYLFARSSPRLSAWLEGHRWLGAYVRAVRDERGVPRRAKAAILAVLWSTIALSLWFLATSDRLPPLGAACLVAVGLGVSWFVCFRIRTRRRGPLACGEVASTDERLPVREDSRTLPPSDAEER